MRPMVTLFGLAAGLICCASPAVAQTFDITSITTGLGGTSAGTSNGIGFTSSPTYIAHTLTTTDGSSTVFSNSSFHNPALPTSDVLHFGDFDVTFTFERRIASALIYVAENSDEVDGELDFGILPTVVSGGVVLNGTRFRPATVAGGLVRLDNINSNTLTHIARPGQEGLHFAMVVTPADDTSVVPEPSAALLFLPALGVVALARKKRTT